jgi:uncharacterized protein
MAFSFMPREDEYFALFTEMTAQIQDGADTLVTMMHDTSGNLESYMKKIKNAEHNCDELTHKITTKLNKSFITPFDREDIYMLVVALDDVLDYIDAGARAILMYDIRQINDHAKQFAKVIQSLAIELHSAISILAKPNGMNQHIVEIHRLENEADDVYFRAIGELFRNPTDAIAIIKWKEVYEILESATDRCESVANIIESVILKHN